MERSEALNRFNGDGFFTWQSKTMYTLMRKGLWSLIEPTTDESSEESSQMHQKALGIIAQNLGDEVLHHITGIRDAKKAWTQLNQVFGSESKSSKMNLLMQFYKLDKKESESMAAHISNFKAIKQQLMSIKKEIPQDEAVAVLLNSVDKKPYDTLVSTLKEIAKTLEEIVSSMLEHESKKKQSTPTHQEETAFYAKGDRGSKTSSGRPPRCFHCGKLGHTQNECRNKDKPKIVCNYCGKIGHTEENCFHKKNQQANFVEEKEEKKESLF